MDYDTGLQTNWSRNQIWNPKKIFVPGTLSGIQEIISKASSANVKVIASGTAHSFNEILIGNDYFIVTDKLNRILNIDKERLRVRVEAGIKLHKLLEDLAEAGLTLPNQGYIREQSIAGVIATATHGSGLTGTLSNFITEIEIVDSHGRLLVLNPQKDPEVFEAAVVNLGCLGIVYAVTLQCVPLFKIRLDKFPVKLEYILENLSNIRKAYPFFQFFRNLYNGQVIGHFLKPTEEPVNANFLNDLQHLAVRGYSLLNMNVWRPPSFLIPLGVSIFMKLIVTRNLVDYNYKILSPEDEGRYIEQELSIPSGKLEEGLEIIKQITDRWAKGGKRYIATNLVRFVEQDQHGHLSPTRDGARVYLSLIAFRKKGVLNFFREIETALYPLQCRPHWGKIHFLTKDKIKNLYGENYNRFVAARKKLDPERMFSNPFIEDLFD